MIMVFKIAEMNVWGCAACTAVNGFTSNPLDGSIF